MTVSTTSDFTGTTITLYVDGAKITKELHVMQDIVDSLTNTLTAIYMVQAQIKSQEKIREEYRKHAHE